MSLASMIFSIVTVKAIENATFAGDRVFDTEVDPKALIGEDAAPGICVYSDAGRMRVEGKELFDAESAVELELLFFIAKATQVEAGEIVITFPATDPGYRNALHVMHWQALKALHDPANAWSDIWATLFFRGATDQLTAGNRQTEFAFAADSKDGTRFAVLRYLYRLELIGDPVPGAALSWQWEKVIAAFEADVELQKTGQLLRQLVTGPALPSWRQAQELLGLTRDGALALGFAPAVDDPGPAEDAPAETAIAAEDLDRAVVIRVAADGAEEDRASDGALITKLVEPS